MWDSLELPWQVCLQEAWAAFCAGSLPIGACVADEHGTILSRGRSRLYEPTGPTGQIFNNDLAHAEMNALVALPGHSDTDRERRQRCVVYTTTEPCPLCLGAFYMSGIRTLRFAARDPWAGSANLIGTTPYLSRKHVTITGPERADLETLIAALHVVVSLRYEQHARPGSVIDTWRPLLDDGVSLGETLYRNRLLDCLRDSGVDAATMVETVEKAM
jgi:tRNA(adenine34) deaminase